MNFILLGTDFRLSDLDKRTAFAKLLEASRVLESNLEERVFLSTCNRFEVYGWTKWTLDELMERLEAEIPEAFEDRSRCRLMSSQEALTHLFRVTASLESMVVGENEITGQVKRYYEEATSRSLAGKRMHPIFQEAFRVAKKIRNETEVGRFAVSIPSIGVKLAEKIFGSLHHRRVAILGLGEIGRLAAEHFASVAPKSLALYNRTQEVAEEIAVSLKAYDLEISVLSGPLMPQLEAYDVIVAAASVPLLQLEETQQLSSLSKDLFILDLGVPPCVAAPERTDLFIYRVDDLQKIAEENRGLREQELARAGEIISNESARLWRRLEKADFSVTLRLLSEKTEEIRARELAELHARLEGISPENWEQIDKMSERLSAKILQDPIRELRTRLELAEERETWLEFFRNIFRI